MERTKTGFDPRIVSRMAALRRRDRKSECEKSLYGFVKTMWPIIEPSRQFVEGWHVGAICEHLEAVSNGDITRLLITVPPGSTKPVSVDTRVHERDRGWIAISDIVVGDRVLTHRGRFRRVSAVHEQGVLSTLKVTSHSGRSVVAGLEHPFLTPNGWIQAQHLTLDDTLANVPEQEPSGTRTISAEAARFLGYLVGDGSCLHSQVTFTNADEAVLADFERCVTSLGFFSTRAKTCKIATSIRVKSTAGRWSGKCVKRPLTAFLESHGIWGKSSYEKNVPPAVLAGNGEIISNFLGAYRSCDGFVSCKGYQKTGEARPDAVIGCDSVNRELLIGIQHLLLRLGVNARLRRKQIKREISTQPGGVYVSWSLQLSTHGLCAGFAKAVPLMHSARSAALLALRRSTFPRVLYDDPIVSVEEHAPVECRCLTVEEDNSFTANDIAVHNSLTTEVFFPAWQWGPRNLPAQRFISASYSESLTVRDNLRFRRLVESDQYRDLWGDRFSPSKDQWGKQKLQNNKTGWKLATSVGGYVVGERGDVFVVDDPHNVFEAESDAIRKSTITWFREVVPTRMNDPERSVIVVIMQRVHEEDVAGIILAEQLGYDCLNLPMRYDSRRHCATSIGFEDPRGVDRDGERLHPEDCDGALMDDVRFPEAVVAALERDLGPYAASAQLQQLPAPRGGGIFQRDWWKLYPDEAPGEKPEEFGPDGKPLKILQWPMFEYIIASVDTAFTAKEENDWSACTVWGVWREALRGHSRLLLIEAWRSHLEFRALVDKIIETCRRRNVDCLAIEAKASGLSVVQEIQRLVSGGEWTVLPINPKGDKIGRAHAVVPLFAGGVVFAPDREFSQMVIDEMATFPKAKHDDLVDSATQALLHLRRMGVALLNEENESEILDSLQFEGDLEPLYDV